MKCKTCGKKLARGKSCPDCNAFDDYFEVYEKNQDNQVKRKFPRSLIIIPVFLLVLSSGIFFALKSDKTQSTTSDSLALSSGIGSKAPDFSANSEKEITTATESTSVTMTLPPPESEVVSSSESTSVPPETELVTEPVTTISETDSSSHMQINPDGTIRVTFTDGPCTLTFPASWNGKILIRKNSVYVKELYLNNEVYDGKLFGLVFTDVEADYLSFRVLGSLGDRKCYVIPVTDVRFNPDNPSDMELYNTMHSMIDGIFETVEVFLPETSETTASQSFEYLYGEINSDGQIIEGYTTNYICNSGEKERQWICEDRWHITAKNIFYSYGITWYECWDTDDGDYYGWIDSKFLKFY